MEILFSQRSWRMKKIKSVAAITTIWFFSILIVQPFGNYPIMDDWSYAESAFSILHGNGYKPTNWTSMPLIVQSLWGALFCKVFSQSYIILRCSILILGLLSIIALYFILLRRCCATAPLSTATPFPRRFRTHVSCVVCRAA